MWARFVLSRFRAGFQSRGEEVTIEISRAPGFVLDTLGRDHLPRPRLKTGADDPTLVAEPRGASSFSPYRPIGRIAHTPIRPFAPSPIREPWRHPFAAYGRGGLV